MEKKKHFIKIVISLVTVLLKMTSCYVFTLYLNDFDMPFKTCVIRLHSLHNLISTNIFFTIKDQKDHSFSL